MIDNVYDKYIQFFVYSKISILSYTYQS